jgi:hypothetical protein
MSLTGENRVEGLRPCYDGGGAKGFAMLKPGFRRWLCTGQMSTRDKIGAKIIVNHK